jgi:hypothetical protein
MDGSEAGAYPILANIRQDRNRLQEPNGMGLSLYGASVTKKKRFYNNNTWITIWGPIL